MNILKPLIITLLGVMLLGCSQPKTYKIGVSQCSDDDWRQKMNNEILRELMFYPEAIVEIRSADDSNDKQIADINYFIDNGFDIIIAAPNEAKALTPVISRAYAGGIPVVLFDRNIEGESFTAWQGADNLAIGRSAADYARHLAGDEAPVIEIHGLQGSTPAVERHEGFIGTEGINVVASGFGRWNYDDAYRVADSLLAIHPDARVIYAHNDRMAIAASDVARQRGLSPYIIGIDAAPQIGLKAVDDSVITATFIYPTEGHQLIRTAMAILTDKPFDRIRNMPSLPAVDSSNVDIIISQNDAIANETQRLETLKEELDDYWAQHTSQTAMFYAVLVIVLLLFGLLFMLLRAFWQHRRHQAALIEQNRLLQEERDKQKVLNEQLDAATSSKLTFFTNVSHDLRTPLTLISEPVERLAASPNISQRERTLMKIAQKNVLILRRLINNILEFRKLENNKLELNLSEVDLGSLVADWSEAFEGLASRKNMSYEVDVEKSGQPSLAIDVNKMESVFYNILSNAFKYTPDGGRIRVEYRQTPDSAIITVEDNGKGISAEDLPMLFDRFFQTERVHSDGSGIGLALAKSFVEMHGGNIAVLTEPGRGSKFTVSIPIGHVENSHEESASPNISADIVDKELGQDEIADEIPDPGNLEQPTVLAIDDNSDILSLLKEILSDSYLVITARSGLEGLKKAEKYVPDLIICDVMMPEMDGLECVRRLKENQITSHIPALMLTACALDEQRVEGYGVGADAYLAKPFNTAVLAARCRNLIEGRQRLHKYLEYKLGKAGESSPETTNDTPLANINNIDSEFYRKFLDVVKENMSNPDLNVESIAADLGVAYGQLYRKIKALTNYRPVELMRLIRLEAARQLLANSEKTISEISYEVGFSTPAYFTKCYRDHFGETPSDTRAPG